MYCPKCGSEYREGFFQCVDCEIALVDQPPAGRATPEPLRLVTVLEGGDPGLLAVAESLLLDAGIPYAKRGEQLQGLFAGGQLGTGFNPLVGPVLLQVPAEHAEAAMEILEELKSGGPGLPEWAEEPD